jgi:hypothetical protein
VACVRPWLSCPCKLRAAWLSGPSCVDFFRPVNPQSRPVTRSFGKNLVTRSRNSPNSVTLTRSRSHDVMPDPPGPARGLDRLHPHWADVGEGLDQVRPGSHQDRGLIRCQHRPGHQDLDLTMHMCSSHARTKDACAHRCQGHADMSQAQGTAPRHHQAMSGRRLGHQGAARPGTRERLSPVVCAAQWLNTQHLDDRETEPRPDTVQYRDR